MSVIVFNGDSITDSFRRTDPLGLGGGYVGIVADRLRERGDDSTLVNTGISGDRVLDLTPRWQADTLDHHPTVLSLAIGVNDTLWSFTRGHHTPHDVFETAYVDLLDRAVAAGVEKFILVEPFYLTTTEPWVPWYQGNEFIHADLAPRREIVARLAKTYGAVFLPLQSILQAEADRRGGGAVAPDGVHPSPHGTLVQAQAWLDAYDCLT